MVHRIGELLIAQETVHQKNAAIFMERARDPNGQCDTDQEITYVGCEEPVHDFPFCLVCFCRYNFPSLKRSIWRVIRATVRLMLHCVPIPPQWRMRVSWTDVSCVMSVLSVIAEDIDTSASCQLSSKTKFLCAAFGLWPLHMLAGASPASA